MTLNLKVDGYYIIRPEHTAWDQVEFTPATEAVGLEVLQTGVGGWIERVELAERGYLQKQGGPFGFFFEAQGCTADAWVNEEGKLEGLPPNWLATSIKNSLGYIDKDDVIAGNMVIVCGAAREKPEQEDAEQG